MLTLGYYLRIMEVEEIQFFSIMYVDIVMLTK